jgi:hypothetical protein
VRQRQLDETQRLWARYQTGYERYLRAPAPASDASNEDVHPQVGSEEAEALSASEPDDAPASAPDDAPASGGSAAVSGGTS